VTPLCAATEPSRKSLDWNLCCRLLDTGLHEPVVICEQHLAATTPRRENQELEASKDESESTGRGNLKYTDAGERECEQQGSNWDADAGKLWIAHEIRRMARVQHGCRARNPEWPHCYFADSTREYVGGEIALFNDNRWFG
jgi:hypothetical protein